MGRKVRGAAIGVLVLGAIAVGCGGGGGGGGGGGTPTPASVSVIAPAAFGGESLAFVVNDSAGAMVSSANVAGTAPSTVVVPAGGSVTLAAALGTTSFGWSTIVDPPDGATLTFANPIYTPVPTPASFQTWNVSLGGAPAGSNQYYVLGPCGQSQTTTTANVIAISNSGCRDIQTAHILALAYSGSNLNAWHETGNLPLVAGAATNESISFDQHAIQGLNFTFFHVPEWIPFVNGGLLLAGHPGFRTGFLPSQSGGINSGVGYSYLGAPVLGAITTVDEAFGSSFGIARVRHLPQVPGSETLDLADYPTISWPALDTPTGAVTWAASGFGDGQLLFFDLSTPSERLALSVVAPPGLDEMHFLEMPPEYVPSSLASMTAFGFLVEADYASLSSYDGLLESGTLPPSTDLTTVTDDAVFLFGGAD